MPVLRFLQISDLHLGAPLAWLPAPRRAERRREQQRALEAAINAAIERRADAILVAGDLFDAVGVDAETLAFAVHAFDRPDCPPVFIAPGNHDPCTATSPYWERRLLAARGWSWPAHVHVFREPSWTGVPLEGAPVTIWGRSFASGSPAFDRPLEPRALEPLGTLDPSRVHVAVFHGSREDACPPGQTVTAPFSEAEALRAPFAYMAVGHYHWPSRIEAEEFANEANGPAGVRLAYAGSAVALSISETGAHGALEVTIEPDAGRRATIEPITLDGRRVHAIEADVTGAASADEIDRRIAAELDAAGVEGGDLVSVRLTGRLIRGVRHEGVGAELLARTFALRLDPREMRPDYDLESIRAREPSTTEDRFAQALLDELDAEADPKRRGRILAALYYGLDAFRLRDVAPAYEGLSASEEEVEA